MNDWQCASTCRVPALEENGMRWAEGGLDARGYLVVPAHETLRCARDAGHAGPHSAFHGPHGMRVQWP